MGKTYRRKPINWSSPREIQPKRLKQTLRAQIEAELAEDESNSCPWCCVPNFGCHIGLHKTENIKE